MAAEGANAHIARGVRTPRSPRRLYVRRGRHAGPRGPAARGGQGQAFTAASRGRPRLPLDGAVVLEQLTSRGRPRGGPVDMRVLPCNYISRGLAIP